MNKNLKNEEIKKKLYFRLHAWEGVGRSIRSFNTPPPLHDLINYILVWREMKPHNQKKSNLAVRWWHYYENKHIYTWRALFCHRL